MSARISLQARIDDYLAERRRLGFQLRSRDTLLASFARYVAEPASPRAADRRTHGASGRGTTSGTANRREPGRAGWQGCGISPAT